MLMKRLMMMMLVLWMVMLTMMLTLTRSLAPPLITLGRYGTPAQLKKAVRRFAGS
jgi:hypothetical protein